VRQQRTAVDSAPFRPNLIAQHSPAVELSRLGQDTLNTPTGGAFSEVWPPEAAFALAQKFELPSTPTQGSWLNMAEMECAALSPQCLDRWIADVDLLGQEVLAWATKRQHDCKTVHWRFAQAEAQTKMKRHYKNIQKFN
jgi:hypothetical protein